MRKTELQLLYVEIYIELDTERAQLPLGQALAPHIKCDLSKSAARQIMFLDKGQQVIISGVCKGFSFSDCTIIDIPEKILLSSEQLVKDFGSDAKTANLKYTGERFSVLGVIGSFAEDSDGMYIELKASGLTGEIKCYVEK